MIYLLTPFVIQSEAKNLENILVDLFLYVTEILPPFGRLNDKIVSRNISFPYIFSLIFTFINQPAIQTITNENNNERHKPGTPAHKKSGKWKPMRRCTAYQA